MTKEEKKALAVSAIRSMRGDDYERATRAFARYTPDEMNELHGQSGNTRREIMDSAKRRLDMMAETIAWLESI